MNQFSAYPLQITRQASAHLNKFDRKFGRPLLERNSGSSEFVRAKRSSNEEFRLEPVGAIEEYRDEASGTVVIAKRAAGWSDEVSDFEEKRVNGTVGKWLDWIFKEYFDNLYFENLYFCELYFGELYFGELYF